MPADARPTIPRSATIAIATAFFVNGASFSSWLPRLPEIRDRLGVTETGLGLTLVGAGIGGFLVSIFSGAIVDRFGSRNVTVATSLLLSTLMPVVAFAPRALVLFVTLIAIGASDGLTDVAMNSQAVILQRSRPKRLMSRMHGLWSLGTVTGGLVSSRSAAAGVTLRIQLLVTSAVLIVVMLTLRRWLIVTSGHDHSAADAPIVTEHGAASVVDTSPGDKTANPPTELSAPARRRPMVSVVVVRLFLVGVAVALTEIPGTDWASLMWSNRFDIGEGRAALGFVSIAGGMLLGRFFGDPVVDRLGHDRTQRLSAVLAVGGIVLATTAPHPWPFSGLGLFVAGLGVSSLFPLMFAAAATMTPGRSHGMSAFTAGIRLGILTSAPLVGFVAGRTTVATALLVTVGIAGALVAVVPLRRSG